MTSGGVRGLAELRRSLDAAADQLRELSPDKAGQLLADEVQATAPIDTGFMAQHVTHVGAEVTVGAPYAVFVNARTGWATKALEAKAARITETYEQAIADVVAQITGA